MSTELRDALGASRSLTLNGVEYRIQPIDLNDLALIEERFDSIEGLKVESIDEMKFVLWLFLRKADPGLTVEERAQCDYPMTEAQAGNLATYETVRDGSLMTFITSALVFSGLIPEAGKEAPTAKKSRTAGATAVSSPS
jgi:hypothetical protein